MGQRGNAGSNWQPVHCNLQHQPSSTSQAVTVGPKTTHKRAKLPASWRKLQSKLTPPTWAGRAAGDRAEKAPCSVSPGRPCSSLSEQLGRGQESLSAPRALPKDPSCCRLLPDLLLHPLVCSLQRATRPHSPLHFRSTVTDKGCRFSISLRLSSSCTPRVGLRRFWRGRNRAVRPSSSHSSATHGPHAPFPLLFPSSLIPQLPSAAAREQPWGGRGEEISALLQGEEKAAPVPVVPSAPRSASVRWGEDQLAPKPSPR